MYQNLYCVKIISKDFDEHKAIFSDGCHSMDAICPVLSEYTMSSDYQKIYILCDGYIHT